MPYFVKTITGMLKPCYDEDKEALKRIKVGQAVEVTFKRKRNYDFHKKYFVLVNLLYENQELYDNVDELRRDIAVECGYFTERVNKFTGEVIKEPKSIKFGSMDQEEFEKLYSDTIDLVIKLIDCDREELINQVVSLL